MTQPHAPEASGRARTRATVFAVLAVLIAAGTAYVAWSIVSGYERRIAGMEVSSENLEEVVVAAVDLRPGSVIRPEDLTLARPPAGIPSGQLFTSTDTLLGQTIGERTLAGEPIRMERLTMGGAGLGVNEVIDPGARAVTIRAARSAAVGGLLRPGFFVDVIVTIRPDTKALNADWVTETILQGVRVIAVGDVVATTPGLVEEREDLDPDRGNPREIFVTLEVEPAEAEQLALGEARGQLHLSLRALDDFEMVEPGGPLVTNALVGLPEPVAKAQQRRLARKKEVAEIVQPPPPAHTTDVIRGGRVSTQQFDAEGNRLDGSRR